LALFALRVGPPEYFMLMAFSLTIVASISGRSLLLGIVAACLGLLLATVGEDMYGSFRFAMTEDMKSGLGVVPVLIGLFALPEMLKLAIFRPEENTQAMKLGDNRLTMKEFRGSLKSIIRGSFIGVILGAIPGIGPSTAAFFSYSEARRTSKNGDRFGEGELEGIAASESANNGCCGATMIPLLALGVPGDVITGVMLGAFMIHGLTPGPLLFQNNIGEVYSLFIGMLFSSFFLFVAGKLTASGFAKISRIPQQVLLPCIVILCVFGIYSVASSPFDVAVLLVMGVVGFVMMVLNIPAAPFLIAFILGPMFEDNMRRSLAISRGDLGVFFQSWISWGFFALTILFVALTIRREWQKWRSNVRAAN
jgi:putative tricarboxylic transport membrane protein